MKDWLYRHRVIARAFITVYIAFFGWTVYWYMNLPNPSEHQTGMVTALFGIGAAWYALYLKSMKGKHNGQETKEKR